MSTSSPSTKFVEVTEYDTGRKVVVARNKIVSAETTMKYASDGGKMVGRVKLTVLGREPIVVDAEPTEEVLRSLMPM